MGKQTQTKKTQTESGDVDKVADLVEDQEEDLPLAQRLGPLPLVGAKSDAY